MINDLIEDTTRKRIDEIEIEINSLKESRAGLMEKWNLEKTFISDIRKSKAEIEELKNQADEFERNGNLAKVAEIRYGKIVDLEKKIKIANERLSEIQKDSKMLKEEVQSEDIAEIVSKWTGIPVSKMLEGERTKLLNMEFLISERVIAQEDAIKAISNALRRSRTGLQDTNRPIGSFIFLGTTGVGKTETARALAEFLFNDENNLIRIDMSEYMEKFSVSRLIGAPPGYVGYDEGGQLTESVRRKPYSVILLDEIEKAHKDVLNVLLQLLDDGRMTDVKGRTVNFTNTVVIMTSNLGTELIQDKIQHIDASNRDEIVYGLKIQIQELIKKSMPPEFLNRIDEIILFKPLIQEDIKNIVNIQLKGLKNKLKSLGISLELSEAAIEWLSIIGFDPQFGARPLKRAIQRNITDHISLKLLEMQFVSGDNILVDSPINGGFTFTKK
jgi:ATP-dependent Clp protease ATP-binding subunit ClpB